MSTFVESLKRLYKQGRITLAKLESLKETDKITEAEFDYIVS